MARIRVLLADDALICRRGWREILSTANDMEVVDEISLAVDVPAAVERHQPDVVLIDLKWNSDKTAGHAAIREIRAVNKRVRIIAFSAYEDLIKEARIAGADSALSKEFTMEELLGTIRTIMSRRGPVAAGGPAALANPLTNRELEVLELVSKGYSDKDIAAALEIAETTAGKHVGSLLKKLRASNRTQAASIARRIRLID